MEDQSGSDAQPESLPVDDFQERLRRHRQFDAQLNQQTRPPDDEVITFQSITLVELYAGRDTDSLLTGLSKFSWSDGDFEVGRIITEALKGYQYSDGVFWVLDKTEQRGSMLRHASMTLPPGTKRIYAQYSVLGPSLVALVLTFVLDEGQSRRLDDALRNDVQSTLIEVRPGWTQYNRVREVKQKLIREIRQEVEDRCKDWVGDHLRGTLSEVIEGPGMPTMALITLAVGEPFKTHGDYMTILGLFNSAVAERLVEHNSVYISYPLELAPNSRTTSSFNESSAEADQWLPSVEQAPEATHALLASTLIADSVNALFSSYVPKLRDIRFQLCRVEFDKESSSAQLVELRDRLLGVSRDISAVSADVEVLLDDPFTIWAEMPLLEPADPNAARPQVSTIDAKKAALRASIDKLRFDEANLRELVLISTASSAEKSGTDLQSQVVVLTGKLSTLTALLLVLTIGLFVIGVASLIVAIFHSSSVVVHLNQPSPFGRRP